MRLVLVAGMAALALAIPGTVSADASGTPTIGPAGSHDATLAIDSLAVTGKVLVTVRMSVVCQPFDSYDWNTGETFQSTDGSIEFATVTILQAQGRTIDSGYTEWYGSAVCDGTTVNSYAVPVTASQSPWRTGSAVLGASEYIADRASFHDYDSASTGPLTVRLGGR